VKTQKTTTKTRRHEGITKKTIFFVIPSCLRAFVVILFLLNWQARADWPEFRGPTCDGHAPPGLPLHWSETQNIKWKTEIPHRGWSTPVVLGNQIWLTTATPDGHDFFAVRVDADSGRVDLTKHLFHCDKPEPLGNPMNGYASPSPVIEPGRVYVHFGSYGTACLDTATGDALWKRDDLPCRHYRGPGSSPILFRDWLILTMDGVDVQYVVALDKKTGKTIWKTDRTAEWNDLDQNGKPRDEGDLRKAYTTPLVIELNGQPLMLSVGAMAAYGYDPQTGREIWKLKHGGFSGATRPIFGRGLAYLATGSGQSQFLAMRPGVSGEVTDADIAWRTVRGVPRLPSPVLVGDLLFTMSDSGIATCWEAQSGKEVWKERLGGEFAASLLASGDRIYSFGQDGKAIVFKAGRTFERLATNALGTGFLASPAVDGKALILRTKTHLYRVEEK
jgi:outer membrane protein assembly factor BamB